MASYGDAFERPDSNTLTGWVESESDAGVLRILASRLSARGDVGGAHGGWAYFDAAYGDDQESSLRVIAPAAYRARLVVRGSGLYTGFTGYVLTIPSIPNLLTIQRFEGVNLQTGAGAINNVAQVSVSALAGSHYLLLVIGTLLRVYRNGIFMLEGTDAVIASGKAGCLCMGGIISEGISDDWRGGDTHAATAWGFHDWAPVPLAMQFDGAPAAWTGNILDIAPLVYALQYAAAPAPWTDTWWGPPDLLMPVSAETPVSSAAVQFWEGLLGIASQQAQPWEALAGVAGQRAQPWEALVGVQAQAAQFWEALARAAAEAAQPWEALARAAVEAGQNWEAVAAATALASQQWEAIGALAALSSQFWEAGSAAPPVPAPSVPRPNMRDAEAAVTAQRRGRVHRIRPDFAATRKPRV